MTPRLICLNLQSGDLRPVTAPPAPAVLCLGNFDGVHIAHAALLQAGQELSRQLQAKHTVSDPILCGVFCFFRPSGDYFLKENTHPTHLTTLKDRIMTLRELGADLVWLCDFPSVRDLSPADFAMLLKNNCGCTGVVCGYNHRFGKHAQGTPALLETVFGTDRVKVVPALNLEGAPVSSSRIRTCLKQGDVETAAKLLGRPYALESKVLHGKSLGHTWGFPTANQNFPADRLIPALGVYAVRCHTPMGVFPGVANIGLRPTVENPGRINCETHIIGFEGNLYGKRIKVEFLKFIRPEQKFDSVEALTEAIRRDTMTAACISTQI